MSSPPVAEAEFADAALTCDAFLGRRVQLLQPRDGYRAATDPVLLAAAVPARAGDRVLDLGCGAGAAALCLAARVPGLALVGLEVQPAYAALARRNAALNGALMEVLLGDAAKPPEALREMRFDHVLTNPPFFDSAAASGPLNPGRDMAHRAPAAAVEVFLDLGLRRLRPGGRLTVIHRAEQLGQILSALSGRAGEIRVLPLAARAGRAAKRVIVSARAGRRGPLRLLAPLVLHADDVHRRDRPDFTPQIQAVLAEAAALDLQP